VQVVNALEKFPFAVFLTFLNYLNIAPYVILYYFKTWGVVLTPQILDNIILERKIEQMQRRDKTHLRLKQFLDKHKKQTNNSGKNNSKFATVSLGGASILG
jgi:hypothetical protein